MIDGYLSDEQIEQLLRPINAGRVSTRDGMSYLQAYDVRAMLIRIFGFARFSVDVLAMELLFETLNEADGNNKPRVTVGYRAQVRLRIDNPWGEPLASYTEWASGDATNFPMVKRADAHDFAMKTAESQAFKRCATNLGDQFGLSLYAKGSTNALIQRTLITDETQESQDEPVDSHVSEVPQEDESTPQTPEAREVTQHPAPEDEGPTSDDDPRILAAADLRDRLVGIPYPDEAPSQTVMSVMREMTQQHLSNMPVANLNGDTMTLSTLAQECLKAAGRRGRVQESESA